MQRKVFRFYSFILSIHLFKTATVLHIRPSAALYLSLIQTPPPPWLSWLPCPLVLFSSYVTIVSLTLLSFTRRPINNFNRHTMKSIPHFPRLCKIVCLMGKVQFSNCDLGRAHAGNKRLIPLSFTHRLRWASFIYRRMRSYCDVSESENARSPSDWTCERCWKFGLEYAASSKFDSVCLLVLTNSFPFSCSLT